MANNVLEIAEKILAKIEEYDRIILFRHFRPDGDATGSTLGLQAILKATYPNKEIYLQNSDFANYVAFLGKEDEPIADELYADALDLVMELAVELPTYQRSDLFAYNSNIIDTSTLTPKEDLTPYNGPLSRIWEVGLKETA